jgi:hypothetical protein
MKGKMIKAILAGAAALAMVGAAQAATIEINLTGASAQYLYWNDAADDFLKTVKGCAPGIVVQKQDSSKKHGVTYTTAACPDGNSYIIRYSAKASYDGICAVKGLSGDPCETSCDGDATKRMMFDETKADGCTSGCLKCVKVTLGASDVAGESFIQESHGQLYGPNGGGYVDKVFTGLDASGLDYYNPLIVPFGFFAHNSVTVTKCLGPDPTEPTASAQKAISSWGNHCYDPDEDGKSADCIGYYKCINKQCAGGVNAGQSCDEVTDCPDVTVAQTNCARVPLDNITRLMATQIFSGQVTSWKDFGDWYADNPIVACLRHAGSGTHATMDLAVMRGNGWGWELAKDEINQPAGNWAIWFNEGSSDLMKCVNQLQGAIGYADSDQLAGTKAKSGQNFPYENVHALKYNGVEPKRANIRNGHYDFWSVQWIYENPSAPDYSLTHPVVVELMDFAANPANLPANKAAYWATAAEMVYMKGGDTAYPAWQGALLPQLP